MLKYKLNPNGTDELIYISKSVENIYEIPYEEAINDVGLLWERIHKEDLAAYKASIEKSMKDLSFWEMQHRIQLPNGKVKWLHGRAMPKKEPDGSIIWDTLGIDITRQKEAEKALEESEAKYRSIIENSSESITLTDEKGRIVEWNQAQEELSEIKKSEAQQYKIWEIIYKMLPPNMKNKDTSAYLEKSFQKFFTISAEGPFKDQFNGKIFAGNKEKHIKQSIFSIPTHKGFRLASITRDITEQINNEQARKQYLKNLEIINDIMLNCTRLDNIDEICQYFGNKVYQIQGKSIVAVSFYDYSTKKIRVRSISGINDYLERIINLFGFNPLKFEISADQMTANKQQYISGNIEKIEDGIYAILEGKLSRNACSRIEKMFGFSDVYTIGFGLKGESMGGLTLILPKQQEIKHRQTLETIANFTSVVLNRLSTEAILHESEKMLSLITNSVDFNIFLLRVEKLDHYRIEFLNEYFEKNTGLKPKDYMGRYYHEIIPKDNFDQEREKFRQAIKTHNPVQWIEQNPYTDKVQIGQIRIIPLYNSHGECTHILGTILDISRQKEVEQSLIESEEKYRMVLDNAMEGIIVLKGTQLVYANPAIEHLTGYSQKEILELNFLEAIYPEDRSLIAKNNQKRLAGENIPSYDFRILSKDGSVKWYLLNAAKIKWEQKDAVLIFVQDIHERKKTEQKLSSTLNELEFVTYNVPNIIWKAEFDENFNFINTYISNNVDSLLGLPAGTIDNDWDKYFSYIKPEYLDQIKKLFKQGIENPGQDYSLIYEAKKSGGENIWFQTTGKTVVINKKLQTVGYTIDVTEKKKAEEALMASESKYRSVFNNALEGIFVLQDDYVVYANPATTELTGYTLEDMKKIKFSDAVYEKDRKRVLEKYERRLKGEHIPSYDFRIITKEGSVNWFLINATRISWNGRDAALVFIQNIHDRKLSEQKLRENKERLDVATKSAGIGVWELNLKNNELIWDDHMHDLYGIEKNSLDLRYEIWRDSVHPNDLKMAEKKLDSAIHTNTNFDTEFRIIRPNGEVRFLKAYAVNVVDQKHRPIKMIGVNYDITGLKQAQQKLIESEEKYREMVEFSPDGILVLDITSKVISLNKAFLEITGYQKSDVFWKPLFRTPVFPNKHFDEYMDNFNNIIKGDIKNNYHFEWRHADGSSRIGQAKVNLISEYNKPIRMQMIFRDITEQRRSEKLKSEVDVARKSARLKEQFLANISHEMRTPMNGIIGMTDFLLDTDLSKHQLEFVQTIKESSESLLQIINDVLSLSRIERGQIETFKEIVSIRKMVERNLNLFKAQALKKKIDLSFSIGQDIPDFIIVDKRHLRQVLYNLISNAVKYTDQGSVNVKVEIEKKSQPNLTLKISVIDSGIGINPLDKEKIFDPFVRLDETMTRTTEGTGLGLSITKKLVELLGGCINFDSIPNKGSIFWFTFDVEVSGKQQQDSASLNNNHIDFLKTKKLSVIMAEDKKVNQKVTRMMLEQLGCSVEIVENGQEFIERFKPNKYDIIILDIMMPVMDGITAMRKLRQSYKKLPPIIGLSAHAMEGDAEKYKKMGMDDYLEKPISTDKLVTKLHQWASK